MNGEKKSMIACKTSDKENLEIQKMISFWHQAYLLPKTNVS